MLCSPNCGPYLLFAFTFEMRLTGIYTFHIELLAYKHNKHCVVMNSYN